jgi:hypothetical protein
MTIQEAEHLMLENIREWLKQGATIRVADPKKPILDIQENGSIFGNLRIEFPKKR